MPPIIQRMALLKIAARMIKTMPRVIKRVPAHARDIRQHRDSSRPRPPRYHYVALISAQRPSVFLERRVV